MALAMVSLADELERPSVAPNYMQTIAPGLAGYIDDI